MYRPHEVQDDALPLPLDQLKGRHGRLQRELRAVADADPSAANRRIRLEREIARTEQEIVDRTVALLAGQAA